MHSIVSFSFSGALWYFSSCFLLMASRVLEERQERRHSGQLDSPTPRGYITFTGAPFSAEQLVHQPQKQKTHWEFFNSSFTSPSSSSSVSFISHCISGEGDEQHKPGPEARERQGQSGARNREGSALSILPCKASPPEPVCFSITRNLQLIGNIWTKCFHFKGVQGWRRPDGNSS